MNPKDNNRNIIDKPKDDGFKFAVTVLTAFGTILYIIYNYFRNIAVDSIWYGYVSLIIPIMIVSSFILILYVFIKGFSMEIEDPIRKDVKKWASFIYLITFWVTILNIILIAGLILLAKKPESSYYLTTVFYIFAAYLSIRNLFVRQFDRFVCHIIEKLKNVRISISNYLEKGQKRIWLKQFIQQVLNKFKGVYIYLYNYREQIYWFLILIASSYYIYYAFSNYNKPDYNIYTSAIGVIFIVVVLFGYLLYNKIHIKQYSKESILVIITSIIMLSLLIWSASFSSFSFFTKGDVIIVMDSIYHKNGTPIPVLIKVTGPDTRLSIKLSSLFSEANSSLRDYIELTPENNPNKTKYLVGNSLGNGKYYVFINTSDLNEGYYELRSERFKYTQVDAKGFYLLNDSMNYRNSS